MKLNSLLFLQLLSVAIGQPEPCSKEGAVKLAPFNPNDFYAGIVEVCHNGYWGTICTDSLTRSWGEKNAHMACWNVIDPVTHKKPYSGALNSIILSTLPKSYQVSKSVPIHYRSIVCDGTEISFANCSQISTNTSACTHDYDAAVVCRQRNNTNDVRLVGSITDGQGAVEMNIAGYGWVRLCPDAFDLSGVCNKLGYTSTTYQTYIISTNRDSLTKLSLVTVCVTLYQYVDYGGGARSYSGSRDIKSSDIESYQSCTVEYTTVCDYALTLYAGVTCSNTGADGSVRLYGGSDPAIGNVEVLYNGVWGGVCATGWNDDAGRLVCAQLGYDSNNDYFGLGFAGSYSGENYLKPIWMDNVNNCSHLTNKKITECSYTPPIGYGQGCSSANVATLQCDFVWTDAAIAGIVVGAILFMVMFCCACCCLCCIKKHCKRPSSSRSVNLISTNNSPSPSPSPSPRPSPGPRQSPSQRPHASSQLYDSTQSNATRLTRGPSSNNSTHRSHVYPQPPNVHVRVPLRSTASARPRNYSAQATRETSMSFQSVQPPPTYNESQQLPQCNTHSTPPPPYDN